MASTVTFHYLGPPEQKHVAKLGPMAHLRAALVEAAVKWRPPVDPATAQVLLNKKPVDLDTPFRLLNIPSGSRLDVIRAEPPAAAAAPASSRTPAAPPAPSGQAIAAPAGRQAAASPAPAQAAAAEAAAEIRGTSGAPGSGVPPALAALGITQPISVFTQHAVEAAAATRSAGGAADADPPDEFFEFTADDFAEVAKAAQKRAAAQSQLLTRALREQQARARANALGPVPVRLHFPDGSIVQAEFAATQPVDAVASLARSLVAPPLSSALYLYTTPPRQVIKGKQLAATLYDTGLVPAAHIHVGADAAKVTAGPAGGGEAANDTSGTAAASATWQGPWLKPEVAALMSHEVPCTLAARAQENRGASGSADAAGKEPDEAAAAQERERAIAEARRRAAGSGADGEGAKKVPKWLKMGSK